MYHDSNSARIDERVDNAKLVKELADEKNKIEKKYSSLLVDVKKFMDEAEKRAVEENLVRSKENTATAEKKLGEKERNQLKDEVDMLKQVQKSQAKIMKVRSKKWMMKGRL